MSAAYFSLVFFGLLSSVTSDEGYPGSNSGYDNLSSLISTAQEKCPEHIDPLSCLYWYSINNKLANSDAFKTQGSNEPTLENKTPEKGSSEENSQEGVSLEVPYINPENHIHKRFAVFRRKNPTARGYKRGPGFRSWGGKRDSLVFEHNLEKKSKFASWGGKRDAEILPNDISWDENDVPEKRPKFQNWGGKRSLNDLSQGTDKREIKNPLTYDQMEKRMPTWRYRGLFLNEPFKKHVPKRPQFQSWGGKRTMYPWNEFFGFGRGQDRFLLNADEKRKFSSWGGKRLDNYGDWRESANENSKRHVFQNWGGKRGSSEVNTPDIFIIKDPDSSDKTNQRDKRNVDANRENDDSRSSFFSWDEELAEGKIKR